MKGFLVIFLVFQILIVWSQQAVVFDKTVHNFGELEELPSGVDHTFRFYNAGLDTLTITNVKASCGCTIPKWTKNPIVPGDSGQVVAHYNSYNRPGAFNKSLKVNLSDGTQQTLYIQGNVLPRTKTIEEELPVSIGALRTKFKTFNMGNFTTEKTFQKSFAIYNDSNEILILNPSMHILPNYVQMEIRSDTILPKTKARITFIIDPVKVGELGFVQHEVRLATNDQEVPLKSYQIMSTIEEYFEPLSETELAKAPHLLFSEGTIDFGDLYVGSSMDRTVTITNNGKSTLNIRQIKSNCDCVKFNLKDNNIEAGGSINLNVSFDASNRKGRQYKTLTVFSNDPSRPTQTLSIKANVK